ncbi:MAG: hypothetical protein KDD44_15030, partial [Bdellovibrionales bacterium]|nr:hypothetical protein [Bdellovibrionales bacterium]
LYLGEYFQNNEREAVRIYRVPRNSASAEVVFEFAPGEIRHVHGLYRDPADGSIWCLTGDRPSECRILRSTDGCKTFETVGGGDETWRAVSIVFHSRGCLYGMDAEFRQNAIFRLQRNGLREEICDVSAPIYYSQAFGECSVFATTAELCPSQVGRSASILGIAEDGNVENIVSFEKDIFPVRYFLAGIVEFASRDDAGQPVVFSTVGLRGTAGRVYQIVERSDSGFRSSDNGDFV